MRTLIAILSFFALTTASAKEIALTFDDAPMNSSHLFSFPVR